MDLILLSIMILTFDQKYEFFYSGTFNFNITKPCGIDFWSINQQSSAQADKSS